MKAISLWQPWATLWLLTEPDEKVFETRHWYTAHRGPLLVHAAKKCDGAVRAALNDPYFQGRLVAHGATRLAFGCLIGVVNLVGCCRMDGLPAPGEREERAGNWTPGRFAWERGPGARLFTTPVPWKGAQGFFDVPSSAVAEVNEGLDMDLATGTADDLISDDVVRACDRAARGLSSMSLGDHSVAIGAAREAGLIDVLRDLRSTIGRHAGLVGCPPVRVEDDLVWDALFDRVQEQLEVLGVED